MASKGAEILKGLIRQFFGAATIVEEFVVGENLRLDYYLPTYRLGFEYHGRQHKEFVEHFHGDASGFRDAKRRDSLKAELCQSRGIGLVVFWDDEELSETEFSERVLAAQASVAGVLRPVSTAKSKKRTEDPERRRERLERASRARKEAYQKAKERRNEALRSRS